MDHVLVEKVFSANILNMRSYRETLYDFDHALVKIKFKSKWPRRSVSKESDRPKFYLYKHCKDTHEARKSISKE